mgnify:CR=1 FL=1
MKTLAIHYGAHDASACIYSNKIEHFFLEERYSRKKHDRGLLHIYENLVASKEKIDRILLEMKNSSDRMERLLGVFNRMNRGL